jgi:hypothetical protein
MRLDAKAGRLLGRHVSEGPDEELLSTSAVAKWLGVSEVWMKIARTKSKGPPFVVPGAELSDPGKPNRRPVFYRRGAVKAWLRSRERIGTSNALEGRT